jgi:hypothetical protein
VAEGTYYARRSARDPAWREAAIAAAVERKRRRRQTDPETVRVAHRLAMRRYRQKRRAHGLTFTELLFRVGGDRSTLSTMLNEEVRRGRVHFAAGRYSLNGDGEFREALRLAPGQG